MSKYAKILISGDILLESGLHIGGNDAFSAIGAIDSPVIRDPLTSLPMIPGSSIKGKMRSLLAKLYNENIAKNPNMDHERITRLFGATSGNTETGGIIEGKLLFRDAFLNNEAELEQLGIVSVTEAKFENTIDRYTATANPRQIERVIKGSSFSLNLVYEVNGTDAETMAEDFETINKGLQILQYDYLGGSGSRGYGQIRFDNLNAEVVVGEANIEPLKQKLGEIV